MSVHPTAIIAPGAQLDASADIGPYVVIGPRVKIGAQTTVGSHTVIDGVTTIGARNKIFHHASVGAPPQDLKYRGEPTELILGDENQVREFATLHTGTVGGGGVTRIGSRNLFMAYSHVAHDCQVGDNNVFANGATLAGHVEVGSFVTLGGLSAVHQFTRLGDSSFLAGGTIVVMDVPPYCMAQGDRAELSGINEVGLKRRGFTDEQVARVKDAYRALFRQKQLLKDAVAQLQAQMAGHKEIEDLLTFITSSKRGVTR